MFDFLLPILVGLALISPFVLLGHCVLGFIAVSKSSINVIGRQRVTGRPARVVGILLIAGGLLSPFTLCLTGFLSLIVAIAIGFILAPFDVLPLEILKNFFSCNGK